MTHLETTFLVDLLREARRRERGAATKRLESLADVAPLVTRNARHFDRVPGLSVLGY